MRINDAGGSVEARIRNSPNAHFSIVVGNVLEQEFNRVIGVRADTYDTIEFLLKHVPNNNGKVGIWGISYPGFYTSASIIDSHPALKAASPQDPMTDLFLTDDAYHG